MEKKNPVVKQDGKDMAINMANAYRMQNRAMLELLGISSSDQLAGLTPEQKAAIPFYPPYDELGNSGKVNAAMHMMRTVIESLTSDMVMRIYERTSRLESMERNLDKISIKVDALLNSLNDEHPIVGPDDLRAIRDDLAEFINAEVVGRMINPEEMVKFITGVNEFIAKHGEFVQAFSTFVATSADDSSGADKHNADVLAAIYDVKNTLSTLSDMSRRIINISDQLFDMQHVSKTSSSEPAPTPKVAEIEKAIDSYGPAYNITIKGDNNGTLNIGTASGCTTFTDNDEDDLDTDIPDEADDHYHPSCINCNFECDDEEDADGLWDDDDNEPTRPYCPCCYTERKGTQFAGPMGEADELNVLASKDNDAPIPYGILDDIRLYAFEVFNHYFRGQPKPRISIFHLNQLIDAMGTRYCHAASMAYVRSLSGNVVDNFYGIVRNEIFRLVIVEEHPSPDEMEDFILYNLGLAYNELLLETLRNLVVSKTDELNKHIMSRLTYLCNDLEDEMPSLCEILKYATFYPKLVKSRGAAEYTIKEYLYNGDLFDKYRNMTRPVAMGENAFTEKGGVHIIPNAAGVSSCTADDVNEACDCDTPTPCLEDNLFCNPDLIFNLKEFEDQRNLYFAEEIIRYGVVNTPLYERVRENAIREFRIAEKNGDPLDLVLARIMNAIYGFRGFTSVIQPNLVKTMIDHMTTIVKDAMKEVQQRQPESEETFEAEHADDSNEEV